MNKKNKNNKTIFSQILLGFLILVFFILLFISSNNTNITKNLILDNSNTLNLETSKDSIEIGVLEIKNPSFLPKRVFLDNYILCSENGSSMFYDINVDYILKDTNYKSLTYDSYYYRDSLDIGSNSNINLSLVIGYYPRNFNEENINQSFVLNLYKIEQRNIFYRDFCLNVDKKDSIKEFTVI